LTLTKLSHSASLFLHFFIVLLRTHYFIISEKFQIIKSFCMEEFQIRWHLKVFVVISNKKGSLLPSPHFPTHTVLFPSLLVKKPRPPPSLSKREPESQGAAHPPSPQKEEAAVPPFIKNREPSLPKPEATANLSSLSLGHFIFTSASASKPRSQHLLHFGPSPCHWDFWLPKPEASEGSLVPC